MAMATFALSSLIADQVRVIKVQSQIEPRKQ
jgi:hypothetical protein